MRNKLAKVTQSDFLQYLPVAQVAQNVRSWRECLNAAAVGGRSHSLVHVVLKTGLSSSTWWLCWLSRRGSQPYSSLSTLRLEEGSGGSLSLFNIWQLSLPTSENTIAGRPQGLGPGLTDRVNHWPKSTVLTFFITYVRYCIYLHNSSGGSYPFQELDVILLLIWTKLNLFKTASSVKPATEKHNETKKK